MKKRALLEMSVETLEAAVAAVRGGADRVELCEELAVGGVTPSTELMRAAREQVQAPIFAMIRPRGGNFCYSAEEFERMKQQIGAAKAAGMDGVVLGILTNQGSVDMERSEELVSRAKPLPVTFHRAFDEMRSNGLVELDTRLEAVIATGATRLLTSGGRATAEEGCAGIARMVERASGRITILPGGGIRPGNLGRIVRETRASEFHSGLTNVLPCPRLEHEEFEAGVRELVRILNNGE